MRDTMLLVLAAIALSGALYAQDSEPVVETANGPDYNSITAVRINPVKDRLARIEGRVIRLLPAPPESQGQYFLQDDSGKFLRVLSQGELPILGESLVVEGRVDFIHVPDRELVLKESGRSKLEQPAEEESPEIPADYTGDSDELIQSSNTTEAGGALIPITAVALLLLVAGGAAAFYFIRQGRGPTAAPSVPVAVPKEGEEEIGETLPAEKAEGEEQEQAEQPGEAEELAPAGDEEEPAIEEAEGAPLESASTPDDRDEVAGEIVRTFYPPPDQVKSIPGRLEVVGGENDLRELYFRLPKDSKKSHFTFGNLDSTDFGHYRINHPSVAENQAKIVFADGEFELINYSIENPTRINSRELQDGERITLNPGDMLEMGVLEMVFHTDDEEETLPGLPGSQAQDKEDPEGSGQPEPDPKG